MPDQVERFEWLGDGELDPIPEQGTMLVLERDHLAAVDAARKQVLEELLDGRVIAAVAYRMRGNESQRDYRAKAALETARSVLLHPDLFEEDSDA
jgi:hypothetical protein